MIYFNTKKFKKKKTFLQQSLSQFLFWRETEFQNSVLKQSQKISTNLSDSSVLIRYLWFSKLNAEKNLKTNPIKTTKNLNANFLSFKNSVFDESQIYNSSNRHYTNEKIDQKIQKKILSQFFPHRKTFIYYWLFPFVGFMGFTFFQPNSNGQFYFNSRLFNNQFTIAKTIDMSTVSNNLFVKKELSELKSQELNSYAQSLGQLDSSEIEDLWNLYFSKTRKLLFSLTLLNPQNMEKSTSINPANSSLSYPFMESILVNNLLKRSSNYWHWYTLDNVKISNVELKTTGMTKPKKIFVNNLTPFSPNKYNIHTPLPFKESFFPIITKKEMDLEPITSYQKGTFLFENLLKNLYFKGNLERLNILNNSAFSLNSFNFLVLQELPLQKGKIYSSMLKHFSCLGTNVNSVNQTNTNKFVKLNNMFLLNNEKRNTFKTEEKPTKQISVNFSLTKGQKDLRKMFFKKMGIQKLEKNFVSKSYLFHRTNPLNNLKNQNTLLSVSANVHNLVKIKNFVSKEKTNILLSKDYFNHKRDIVNQTSSLVNGNSTNGLDFLNSINNQKFAFCELILLRQLKEKSKNLPFCQINLTNQNRVGTYFLSKNKNKQNKNFANKELQLKRISKLLNQTSLQVFEKLILQSGEKMRVNKKVEKIYVLKYPFLMSNSNFLNSDSFNEMNQDGLNSTLISNLANKSLNSQKIMDYRTLLTKKLVNLQNSFGSNLWDSGLNETGNSFLFKKSFNNLTAYEQHKNVSPIVSSFDFSSNKPDNSLEYPSSKIMVNLNTNVKKQLIFFKEKLSLILNKEQIRLLDQHQINKSLNVLVLKPVDSFNEKVEQSNQHSVKRQNLNSFEVRESVVTNKNLSKKKKLFSLKKEKIRKSEKIFRTYLSCKSTKNSFKKSSSKTNSKLNPYVMYTLQKVKMRLKEKNALSKKNIYTHSSPYGLFNSSAFNKNLNQFKNRLNPKSSNLKVNGTQKLSLWYETHNKRLSPNALLTKLGFIFLDNANLSLKNENSVDIHSSIPVAPTFVNKLKLESQSRIEKLKLMQKKRRKKKLKLENRRRKKRKRFFPRPKWLRFNLYSRFLKIRHYKTYKKEKLNSKKFNFISSFNFIFPQKTLNFPLKKLKSNKFERKDSSYLPKTSLLKNSFYKLDNNKFSGKIYRQNKHYWGGSGSVLNWNYLEKENRKKLPLMWNIPLFENNQFYQISNSVMSDFQRLCWKSYWLRSNLTPYIQRVQSSLKEIQKSEKNGNSYSNLNLYLNYLLGTDKSNWFKADQKYFSLTNRKDSSLMWYLNVKNSNQHVQSLSNVSFFQNSQNVAEYNRILFDRMSDVIKNVKSNLTVNGQSHARTYKRGRFKAENRTYMTSTSPNGETKEQLISNDFFSRLGRQFNPQISAFSMFSSSIDSSMKPYGELPTLRVLWALNKTNMLSFISKNEVKSLWANIKTREQNKSNKTKRFLSKSWKTFVLNLSNLSEHSKNSKQNSLIETEINGNDNVLNKQTTKQKKHYTNLCFKKVNLTDKKLQFFGVSNKNYGEYLRHLKISLKSQYDKPFSPKSSQRNSTTLLDKDFYEKKYTNSRKVLKNSSTFWWSTLQSNNIMETSVLPEKNMALHSIFSNTKSNLFKKDFSSNGISFYLIENSFCICLALFNLCVLFSFLRISEVRSFIKFNLLISYKIFNSYLVVLYYVFNLLKNNKNQIVKIYKTSFKTKIIRKKRNSPNLKENSSSEELYNKNQNLFLLSYISIWENFWNGHFKIKTVQSYNFESFQNYSTNMFEITLRSPSVSNKLVYPLNPLSKSNALVGNFNIPLKFNVSGKWMSLPEKTNTDPAVFKLGLGVPQNSSITTNQEQSFLTLKKGESLSFQILNEQKNMKKLINTNLIYQIFKSFFLKNRTFTFISITNTKTKSFISLFVLYVFKFYINLIYQSINLCYAILFQIISFIESIMLIIYKFLEKPAELMVEWIAQIFLVEWSSDVTSYVPASTDIYLWNSFQKFWRTNRFFGFLGFLIERRFWCFFHVFLQEIMKPDSDIIVRQKKGIIFWDIWAEILIKAAEQYNINIPSLTTLREEQEVLIEKLLDDQNWEWCQSSMYQLTPLINAVHITSPNPLSNFRLNNGNLSGINYFKLKTSFVSANFWTKFQKRSNQFMAKEEVGTLTNGSTIWRRWSVNQYFTLQGVDTDLFVDLHLPKSFCHMTTLKYYEPIQPTLGSLVCQIYSGLLKKQVSKNLLVVGAPGTGKSLLIQALAGETEAKLISDNAHRYAYVQRGVAVGMKLLRDVFDAIALHTPCLFLMEDIHLIGERRPMLISDDENSKAADQSFVGDNEEVHEKNQIIYQLNRHSIAHYKKPYKGDFSLLIPTNHFCFSLFLGVSPARVRKSGISPKSPLPISIIENQLESTEKTETGNSQSEVDSSFSNTQKEAENTLTSRLQFMSEKLFAPPATSPFTILVMKEQKKLKPRKLVTEMPWGGLSWDQMMLVPKVTYSIRVKVALLADIAISNLSFKLDMITDLLVIMDSVRSNRGFVVFATTHIPYVLDPALRRPGRLDETISLPLFPNFLNRLQILKTNFVSFSSTLDFVDYSNVLSNLNETEISSFISKTKLLLLNNNSFKQEPSFMETTQTLNYLYENILSKSHENVFQFPKKMNATYKEKEIQRKFQLKSTIQNSYTTVERNYKKKFPINSLEKAIKLKLNSETEKASTILQYKEKSFKNINRTKTFKVKNESLIKLLKNFSFYSSIPTGSSNLIGFTYFQISKFLINSQLDGKNYSNFTLFSKFQGFMNKEESLFRELYSSNFDFQNNLMLLLAGKVGEFFIFNNDSICRYSILESKLKEQGLSSNSNSVHWSKSLQTYHQTGLWSLSGVDSFWQSATSLVFSLIQKRFLYNQNLLVSRMLYFDNLSTLKEPPSPPGSSILMPAKKYENWQRTSRDFQEKSIFSINEKIQMHQQQRLIKKLYNKPIKEYFRSEMIKNRLTSFNTSFKELGYLDSFLKRPSSSHSYYTNRILKRHKFYLVNQWWNGQLEEHNVETTFLSDVDWRSMFLSSLGDLTIDFPDADQHYNPRQRRWFLQSSYSSYWYTFEKTIPYEIYSHFMKSSFHKVYNFLDSEREILDYLAFLYLKKGVLKEIDLISLKSRFYLIKQTTLIE